MSDVIELDVGGISFKTTRTTLVQANYFKSMFSRWNDTDGVIFIDRSPTGFAHVLDFLRDSNYKVPERYQYELDFYGIEYNESNIKVLNKRLNSKLDDLSKRFDKLDRSAAKLERNLVAVRKMVAILGKIRLAHTARRIREYSSSDFDYSSSDSE